MSQASNTVSLSTSPQGATSTPRGAWRSGFNLSQFYLAWTLGAAFPAMTGLIFYGWRAAAMLVLMLSTTVASIAVWKKIGARGRQLHLGNSLWLTTLLWLMLPAHLLQGATSGYRFELWPIPAAASMLLVTLMWLLGGVGSGRIHPVLAAYLLLVVACDQNLTPYSVLQRNKVGLGDIVLTAPPVPINAYMKEGYLKSALIPGADALELEPASSRLLAFTSGQRRPGRSWLSLESLLRDEMPPLEDLMIGGQPGPIGSGCGVAVIIGGLFLLYRGIIDFRVPLSLLVGAVIAFLALPIPVIIKDPGDVTTPSALVSAKKLEGIEWRWFAMREKQVLDVGPAKAITFANYELMSGPMLLMTFFLATSPSLRPMARRARVIFGLLVGITAAGLQLYMSISYGPYLGLLVVSLITPLLERLFRQHPLV